MFYTYVLQSKESKEICIGFTSDLRHRLSEHNQGLNFSTIRYRLLKRRLKDYLYRDQKI